MRKLLIAGAAAAALAFGLGACTNSSSEINELKDDEGKNETVQIHGDTYIWVTIDVAGDERLCLFRGSSGYSGPDLECF